MRTRLLLALALIVAGGSFALAGDYTPTHRKQLREAQTKLGVAARSIRSGDTAAAQTAVDEAEAIVATIREESGYDADHAVFRSYNRLLEARKEALGVTVDAPTAAAAGGEMAAGGVSFSNDIQPWLNSQCTRCHGAGRQSGNIRLDSFAALSGRGRSGPLVTAGLPDQSTIYSRLITDSILRRMPKNGPPVESDMIAKVRDWIIEGAKNDGDDAGGAMMAGPEKKLPENVTIPKPTGNETVSFTKDIAPFMVKLCIGCHTGPNARSGLSLASFHDMMAGGDSGQVVIPGDRTGSRLFRLTGGLENPRMPGSRDLRLTRQNYEDLKTWFDEGNTFDGDDPKALLTSYVESPAQKMAAERAAMSPAERATLTDERRDATAKRAMSSVTFATVTVGLVHASGDVDEATLKSLAEVANNELSGAATKGDLAATGGIVLYVLQKGYTFNEFSRELLGVDAAREQRFFAKADGDQITAVVQVDAGRGPLADLTDEQVVRAATQAAAARSFGMIPRWLAAAVAMKSLDIPPKSPLGLKLLTAGSAAVRSSRDVLSDDYSAAEADAAAYVIGLMLEASGVKSKSRLAAVLEAIGSGQSVDDAIRTALGQTSREVGESIKRRL